MTRCRTCVMPDTRPDTPFIDGECAACVSYRKRDTADWEARQRALVGLLDRHHGECVVASSGGKDSTYIAVTLARMGVDVLCATATTCHLTHTGRQNLDNLARHVGATVEVTPNRTKRAALNRLGLQLVGDISWPEHAAIFSIPWHVAADARRSLIFYGENPQESYGGPDGTDAAMEMTPRWRSEFGGFLGLRPADLIGMDGLTERDMRYYRLPEQCEAKAYFFGQFVRWDSHRNATVASEHGMRFMLPCHANRWVHENLDNAQTGIHDYMMWLKYGYGRGCAQVSVDVRTGGLTRDSALDWVEKHDGLYHNTYMGRSLEDILACIGMSVEDFDIQCARWKRAGA